ncbi:helix-turn-helix domain-containing protein [Desulforhopalus vacuolatus]|nr:helix-turn-helix domain-containing protein [Desulforhopalus vacuolatus]
MRIYQISAFLQKGRSLIDIVYTLNRSKSTISREIYRNFLKIDMIPLEVFTGKRVALIT